MFAKSRLGDGGGGVKADMREILHIYLNKSFLSKLKKKQFARKAVIYMEANLGFVHFRICLNYISGGRV